MDDRASGRFDAQSTPRGWVYSLREDQRIAMHSRGVAIWWLVVVVMFASGAAMLGCAVAAALSSEWSGGEPVLLIFAALGFGLGSALAIGVLRRQFGRDEVRLDARAIRATWRLGPFSWSRTIERSSVAEFTVVRRSRSVAPDAPEDDEFHVLTAEDPSGQRQTLVANYPRSVLLALAVELSSRWKTLTVDPELVDVGAKKLAVAEDTEVPTEIRDRSRPPRGTRLVFERVGSSGARIGRPPRGFASAVAIIPIIIGIMALFPATILALSALTGWAGGNFWAELGVPIVLLLVGVCAILNAVKFARSESWLTVTPDSLTLMATGLASTATKTWTRPQIASIRVDVRVVPSSGSGEGPLCIHRLLLRPTDAPCFSLVASAEEEALVQLLRKLGGAPDSEYLVVGARTGPGEIVDRVPLAAGWYDYAIRQETPTCKLGPRSASLTLIAEPEEELFLGANLSKPELEWIATTLRGVLGVPASSV